MAKSKYIETLEEQYTKKDAKSVLRYKAPDNKWRYVQTSKDANGGNMPSGGGITEVTWQELKDKRDNGELNPGSLYRITDYQCTTTQENTQSAGHQFDIVLLALSENKLAEEGWAMMHDNIYDVVFNDEKTIKCYVLHNEGNQSYSLVDCNTKLGGDVPDFLVIVNETNKTITSEEQEFTSSILNRENLTYNYFQNSNLSAWKVWYCLDNDKSRFAWADDSMDEGTPASINNGIGDFVRYLEGDKGGKYAWYNRKESPSTIYTDSEEPTIGGDTYIWVPMVNDFSRSVDRNVTFYTPAHEGTGLPNGRGVIYRLIDEWNNDVPYDFKNIQFDLGKGWYAPFYDGEERTRDASLDGTFANNKVVPNGEGLLGIISNNIYDVKGCIFVHTNQTDAFQPDGNIYNVIIKDGTDLRLW